MSLSLYGKLYFSFLYPFYESTLRKRKTFDHYRYLKDTQWRSRDELLDIQFGELKKLLEHAYEQVPFYRDSFREVGITPDDIKGHEDLRHLPVIDKNVIRENKERMTARNMRGLTMPKATGGSTGQPLEFEYTRDSYEWRVATRLRGYEWAGCREGEKTGYIWGVAVGNPPWRQRAKERLHHAVLRQKYFNTFEFDDETIADVCRRLKRYGPEVLVAYTTPMYNFAVSVREQGIEPPRVRSVITAAEKVQDFQRKTIEDVFGCKVFNTYGSREFMLIASECEAHSGLHVNVENLFVEIVHDRNNLDPGGPGELLVTDLHNYGMPFIRYNIGDLGVPWTGGECGCGRGLPMIADVEGRLLDTIVTPAGRMVPGEFFPHLAKEFSEIKQFQVVQDELDRLVIKIVPSHPFTGEPLDQFKGEIVDVIGEDIALDIQMVDEIPLTATGKYRVTVSNVWKHER
jgi:phenylacetate-CoA ligase